MFKIEKRSSGYLLHFSGSIDTVEMQQWYDESKSVLVDESRDSFGVIIDMKDLQPIGDEAGRIMKDGQKLYKDKGMLRSAVILNSKEVAIQFKTIAIQTGIYETERYIDASSSPNPEQVAVDWVNKKIDPDK